MAKKKRLLDEFSFPGFRTRADVTGIFGDAHARIIHLQRHQKKHDAVPVEPLAKAFTIVSLSECVTWGAAVNESNWNLKSAEWTELENGQTLRYAVHGGATGAIRHASASSHRCR
jgi:hypothetical protein